MTGPHIFLVVLTLLGLCTLLIITENRHFGYLSAYLRESQLTRAPTEIESFHLDFFPKDFNFTRDKLFCEDLFSVHGTAAANFEMSNSYKLNKDEFDAEIKKISGGMEGHSGKSEAETRAFHYMGSSPNVKHICETGFNAGHSSFNWLTSNDKATVQSFDLGVHKYAFEMAKYMKYKFKERFSVTFGNSVKTIPKFSAENPHYRCDLILVDGGHQYEVALADINNFIPMASEKNLIIIDDIEYPNVRKAWEKFVRSGRVKELMRCFNKDGRKAFCVGTVVK